MTERTASLTMSVSEAAKELGITVIPIAHHNLTHVDGFPAIRIGRRTLVSRDGLREWVKANEGNRLEVSR